MKTPNQKHELRHFFIREFVKELINNTEPSFPEKIKEPIQEVEKEQEILTTDMKKMRPSDFRVKPIPLPIPQPRILQTQPSKKSKEPMTKGMQISPRTKIDTRNFPVPRTGVPKIRPLQGNVDLGKLNSLITDPRVQSIECPGPNKNILVKKAGAVQTTSVALTKEEIQNIINNFSEITRIPLLGNIFKAVHSNLIMTAVISDFVGNRFVVQKRTPLQKF